MGVENDRDHQTRDEHQSFLHCSEGHREVRGNDRRPVRRLADWRVDAGSAQKTHVLITEFAAQNPARWLSLFPCNSRAHLALLKETSTSTWTENKRILLRVFFESFPLLAIDFQPLNTS